VVLGINLWEAQGTVQNYQNQYPNILMLMDPGTVWAVYKQGGYIPLNYVIDHNLNQTIDYWSEGYTHSTIESHIVNLLSDVSVDAQMDAYTYHKGAYLGFDLVLTNWAAVNRTVYMLIDIEMPNSSYYAVGGATAVSLSAGQVRTIRKNLPIPTTAPTGDYMLRVRLGLPPADLWFAEYADFEIVP